MKELQTLVSRAVELFTTGYNCSQSSFVALCEYYGVEGNPKVASCFGGGIGRSGGPCGILTGSLMAIGTLFGTSCPEDKEGKERITEMGKEFLRVFKDIEGKVDCKDLTGMDIATPEGYAAFSERGLKKSVCIPLMEATMLKAAQFIEKEGKRPD